MTAQKPRNFYAFEPKTKANAFFMVVHPQIYAFFPFFLVLKEDNLLFYRKYIRKALCKNKHNAEKARRF
jgi:hypothetical protein